MEYIKDRTEAFDDYYPCRKKAVDCNNLDSCLPMVLYFSYFYTIYSKSQSKINIIRILNEKWKGSLTSQPIP